MYILAFFFCLKVFEKNPYGNKLRNKIIIQTVGALISEIIKKLNWKVSQGFFCLLIFHVQSYILEIMYNLCHVF